MADAPEARAWSPKRLSANGRRSLSWRRCVATGSPRPASSTDRSMAQASALMSSRFSSRSSRQATLSSWTTSEVIRAAPFAPPPRGQSQTLARPPTCPDLNPIEQAFAKMKTLLRRPTPEPSNRPGEPSAPCSTASPRQNAPRSTSPTQDMLHMLRPKQIAP